MISDGIIYMGSAVTLDPLVDASELLPRADESAGTAITASLYGIAVGGDNDGVYGDGTTDGGIPTKASNGAGEGVVVVTQGRCLARVESTVAIAVGDPLGSTAASTADDTGVLIVAAATSPVIARALQAVAAGAGYHIIAVDVQREGSVE
jgi:uncharacterized membrane protein